jgi:hypothetical protein
MHTGFVNGILSLISFQEQLSVETVEIIARQKGNRRWYLPHEFPLVDCQGISVMRDRRRLADRRKVISDLDDLIAILSGMSSGHTD